MTDVVTKILYGETVPSDSLFAMNELDSDAAFYQIQAFESYHGRGGRFSFEEWMDSKGFTSRQRSALRAARLAR